MTDPSIEHQRRQAAADGPSLALRKARRATMSGGYERLVSRPPLEAASQASDSEWQELDRRRRELERLERG